MEKVENVIEPDTLTAKAGGDGNNVKSWSVKTDGDDGNSAETFSVKTGNDGGSKVAPPESVGPASTQSDTLTSVATVSLPLPAVMANSSSSSQSSFTAAVPSAPGSRQAQQDKEEEVTASFTYSLSSVDSLRRRDTPRDMSTQQRDSASGSASTLPMSGSQLSLTQFDASGTPPHQSAATVHSAQAPFDSHDGSGIGQFSSRDGSRVGLFDNQGDFGPDSSEECSVSALSPLPPDPEESCEQGLDTLCLRELFWMRLLFVIL
jgi:hypothetical protein